MDDYLLYGFAAPRAKTTSGVSLSWGRLPEQMSLSDFRQFTNGAIDPMPDIKTGMRQAAGSDTRNVKRYIKAFSEIPSTRVTKDIRMAPILIMPDFEKERLDSLNKEKIIF